MISRSLSVIGKRGSYGGVACHRHTGEVTFRHQQAKQAGEVEQVEQAKQNKLSLFLERFWPNYEVVQA